MSLCKPTHVSLPMIVSLLFVSPQFISLPFISLLFSVPTLADPMTLSGTPPTEVIVGDTYRFLPLIENADMSRLQFNYINKPEWSKAYRSSGLIWGTPLEPGVYADIQIGAWDGSQYALLAPFTITVTAPPAAKDPGVANVDWLRPVLNVDGSLLEDLAGYVIRYGTSAAGLDRQLTINSAATTEAKIQNLSAGTWFFEVAAINAESVASSFSPLVGATVK